MTELKRKRDCKTLWFFFVNALVAISGVGLQYVGMIDLTPTEQMQFAMVLTTVQTVGGVWLRLITKQGVK